MSKPVNGPRVLDAERRQQIVAFVDEHHGATVGDLSEGFVVSEATVRRDLILLSRRGLIERAHGGAIPRRTHDARVFPIPLWKASPANAIGSVGVVLLTRQNRAEPPLPRSASLSILLRLRTSD
jgi:hypothetical protein